MDFASRNLLAEYDLGNLLYDDKGPIEANKINKAYIHSISLNCVKQFLKSFWSLPTEQTDDVMVSVLPDAIFRLPREKQPPSVRDATRWDRFAKLKGITKHKKSRKVWDDISQAWKPRWGKDRVDAVKDKWCIEVPANADPYEDQFEKLTTARNEKRAKNEFARLKNISRSVKEGQAPPVGILTQKNSTKNELTRALEFTKKSDASMGRFSENINEDKIAAKTEKKQKKMYKTGKKSKKDKGPSRHAKGGKGRSKLSNK